MKNKNISKAFLILIAIVVVGLVSFFVKVPDASADKLQEIQQQIDEYEKELSRLNAQANTLKNQINQFDAQINLTQLQIQETEERINLLGGRIDTLEVSLQSLTEAFTSRANETYKMARLGDPLVLLITSENLTEAVTRFHYLQKIQEADRDLLQRLQDAQNTYVAEKDDQEELQTELNQQKQVLGVQKEAKAQLLEVTQNDEKKYQELLAKARAELEAIQSILVGRGEETEAGRVSSGQPIASIIPGVSACSSGSHLHFEVVKDQAHQNPASFLSPKTVEWDNAPDSPFSFTGSWPWPLNDPIRITQGYGMTYYASQLNYYGGSPHTGVDMVNNDYTVKAVQPGVLYRGAIGCGGGTLRYVRVKQDDGFNTYFLHVNYY
jgi:peptidoglycan hydrolase CwlO-like protein